MNLDIGHILQNWPYEPGEVSARRIRGADGKDKIQLRLDMGLLQMEVDGRPDGARPNGFESLLDYYEHQRRREVRADGAESFELDEKACELLRAEGMMYYHRYLAQFVLEDYEAVERDTMRNLRVMDLCARYAKDPSDRFFLEQYRAYVLMMCARARARMAVRDKRPKAALAAVQRGMDAIQAYYKRMAQEEAIGSSTELAILRAMAHEIQARIPVDPLRRLRDQLDQAVKDERYEDAAKLRDRLDRMTRRRAKPRKSDTASE